METSAPAPPRGSATKTRRMIASSARATTRRDEETLEAVTYANRLPEDLTGRQVFVLDPMLATGGSMADAIHFLLDRGADDVTAVCLLAAPEGITHLEESLAATSARVKVVTGAVDERLNDKGYIVPGLGDAGDRLYGVVD